MKKVLHYIQISLDIWLSCNNFHFCYNFHYNVWVLALPNSTEVACCLS